MTSKAGRVADDLRHMLDAVRRIESYTAGMDEAAFMVDERTQDAVIRNLKVVGESARNVQRHDPEFADRNRNVPWALAYQMRNALSHGYASINLRVVWDTVRVSLPGMQVQIAAILDAVGQAPLTGCQEL